MSATGPDPRSESRSEPTEEELRAAYEAEIKKIRVEHVLLENIVTLINLGMRRTGLTPGTEAERDPDQVRLAVEAVRAALPVVEQAAPAQAGPIRDALSQLQLAFVRIGGQPAGAASGPAGAPGTGTGGPGGGGTGGGGTGGGGTPGGGPGGGGTPGGGPGGGGTGGGGTGGGGTGGGGTGAGGPGSAGEPPEPPPQKPGEPGPAQRSGRLWIPGQ